MTHWKKTLFAMTAVMALAGCGGGESSLINVVSREDGSGTRSAFVELFGVEEKDASGEKTDRTTSSAEITNSTSVMMTTVSSDANAIGYISLGSLDDSVKAVSIDGALPSVENVENGSYKVTRPFNVITSKKLDNEAAGDFMTYVLSSEGQKIVEEQGYIPLKDTEAYKSSVTSGKVVVAGSSSVTPVMEKLSESYQDINTGVSVEIQQSDSTTGVTSARDGLCDLGMASRDLKDDETSYGLTTTVIATDGIAVIVNNDNAVNELTSDQVKSIFTGETTDWGDLS